MRPSGLLESGEQAEVEAHLRACAPCRDLAATVEQALEVTVPPARPLPEAGWDRLARAIEAERAGRPAALFRVALACTFCHADLRREEAAFCAACLAPHHGDCFEGHGRCSAPGCGETRLVEPRRKRPRRGRVVVLAVALAGGAAAVAALGSRASHTSTAPVAEKAVEKTSPPRTLEESIALTGESESPPPPYPWPELEAYRQDARLEAHVAFDCEGTLAQVGSALAALAGRPIAVEPEFAGAPVALHLRDVSVRNAILLATDVVPETVLGLRPDGGLAIGRCEGIDCRDEALGFAGSGVDVAPVVVSNHVFAQASLEECVAWLASASGLDFVIANDVPTTTVTGVFVPPTPLATVLGALELSQPVVFSCRHGAFVVERRRPHRDDEAPEAPGVIEAASVPEVIRMLRERRIPCVATPTAWRSGGTLSASLGSPRFGTIASGVGFGGLEVRMNRRRPGFVIEGEILGVRAALASHVPAGWTGVRGQLSQLVGELKDAVRALDSRTSSRDFHLHDKVHAVHDLVRRAVSLGWAPQRLELRRAELLDVRSSLRDGATSLDHVTREREAFEVTHAGTEALESLERVNVEALLWYPSFVARHRKAQEEHEEVMGRLRGRTEPMKISERNREEDEWIERCRRDENERRMQFDRVRDTQAKYPRALEELRLKAMRASNDLARLLVRDRELVKEIDGLELDVELEGQVEKGARIPEAK